MKTTTHNTQARRPRCQSLAGSRRPSSCHRLATALLALAIPATTWAQTQQVEVLEYMPAPGQFVNVLPQANEDGPTTHAQICKACTDSLANGTLISLGAMGGYITVAFDHPVANRRGSDLRIRGNAFYSPSAPLSANGAKGGSIEPGIVYVGVGDDLATCRWYELAGSEYYYSEVHDFSITYYRPLAETGEAHIKGSVMDKYIRWNCHWTTADGAPADSSGWHFKNASHRQTYWPAWAGDSLTFRCGWLPCNAVDLNGKGTYWTTYRYAPDAYGYVDASRGEEDWATFDLDWAVDEAGRHVDVDSCRFVRVQTAVFQQCGWIGETSTEVASFEDLHLTTVNVDGKEVPYDEHPIVITTRPLPSAVHAPWQQGTSQDEGYYDLNGRRTVHPQPGRVYVHQGRKVRY